MPNKVLSSLENSQGDLCIDIFERPDGTFGFEEYRRDAEDNGRWEDAVAMTKSGVPWLK